MSPNTLPFSSENDYHEPSSRWHRAQMPILVGPLRGKRWLPASGGKVLRVLLGSYEREQTALFRQYLNPGDVVFDVGAANGYYTLLASQLVGRRGHVVSFEPNPKNAKFLRNHVDVNRATNVTVHQAAVGAKAGAQRFAFGTGTGTGKLADDGQLEVRVLRLDDIVSAEWLRPAHLKIDVEGGELGVLEGACETLEVFRPSIFLSTHGTAIHKECCDWLRNLGYKLDPIIGSNLEETSEVFCRAA